MGKIINTGVIGFGLSGKVFHAPFLHAHEGFNLTIIVERHNESAKEIYPGVTIVKDYNDLLTDPAIELIVICTPNTSHFQIAKACLEAGKHIIVEKPFMPTSDEADQIIRLAARKNLKVFVYQNRRWDGDFLTIRKLIEGDLLGDINYYESHFDRYSPERTRAAWRDEDQPGSGNLFDLGSHLIDQVLCLFGNPISVKADLQAQRKGSQVDDFFELTLKYPGLYAVVIAGMLEKEHDLRYVLKGSNGHYTKNGIDPQEDKLKQGILPTANHFGKEESQYYGNIGFKNNGLNYTGIIETEEGNYMSFFNNVYNSIVKGESMVIRPEEARDVIRIIELAFQSSKEKREIEFQ